MAEQSDAGAAASDARALCCMARLHIGDTHIQERKDTVERLGLGPAITMIYCGFPKRVVVLYCKGWYRARVL